MRVVKPVLFSLLLSLLIAPGSLTAPSIGLVGAIEHEPGGPLNAAATLIKVIDGGGQLRALVRLDLVSDAASADVAVTEDSGSGRQARQAGRASLLKGRRHVMFIESDLQAGRENHLLYKLDARGQDGSRVGTTVYLRVNLDPSLEPAQVGDTLEYQGAPGGGVQR